jgi:hypothetical protein
MRSMAEKGVEAKANKQLHPNQTQSHKNVELVTLRIYVS